MYNGSRIIWDPQLYLIKQLSYIGLLKGLFFLSCSFSYTIVCSTSVSVSVFNQKPYAQFGKLLSSFEGAGVNSRGNLHTQLVTFLLLFQDCGVAGNTEDRPQHLQPLILNFLPLQGGCENQIIKPSFHPTVRLKTCIISMLKVLYTPEYNLGMKEGRNTTEHSHKTSQKVL